MPCHWPKPTAEYRSCQAAVMGTRDLQTHATLLPIQGSTPPGSMGSRAVGRSYRQEGNMHGNKAVDTFHIEGRQEVGVCECVYVSV